MWVGATLRPYNEVIASGAGRLNSCYLSMHFPPPLFDSGSEHIHPFILSVSIRKSRVLLIQLRLSLIPFFRRPFLVTIPSFQRSPYIGQKLSEKKSHWRVCAPAVCVSLC